MKSVAIIAAIGVVCACAAVGSAIAAEPQQRLVKTLALQSFFHTAHPWEVRIYQPVWGDAALLKYPVRVCFSGPPSPHGPQVPTNCTPLYAPTYVRSVTYPCQIFESAKLEILPGAGGSGVRPSLVVRANYSSGTAGALHGVFVWTFQKWDKPTKTSEGWFDKSFETDTSERGQQKFIKTGPLASAFVSADQVFQSGTLESPMRFSINVYEPAQYGYLKVLSFVSTKRYPSNHTDRGTTDPITLLAPEIARALKAVCPTGTSILVKH